MSLSPVSILVILPMLATCSFLALRWATVCRVSSLRVAEPGPWQAVISLASASGSTSLTVARAGSLGCCVLGCKSRVWGNPWFPSL